MIPNIIINKIYWYLWKFKLNDVNKLYNVLIQLDQPYGSIKFNGHSINYRYDKYSHLSLVSFYDGYFNFYNIYNFYKLYTKSISLPKYYWSYIPSFLTKEFIVISDDF